MKFVFGEQVVAQHGVAGGDLLGQGGGIPKIGAGFVKPMDEVRLMEEGLTDTVCANCGALLEPDSTFIARDDFYCEKCYNEIPESEREISSEESN